ncbi:MAG: hypothetical protein AAFR90_00165 [Pseudomonadota bacterium]
MELHDPAPLRQIKLKVILGDIEIQKKLAASDAALFRIDVEKTEFGACLVMTKN